MFSALKNAMHALGLLEKYVYFAWCEAEVHKISKNLGGTSEFWVI
jgi:hypothetical protein